MSHALIEQLLKYQPLFHPVVPFEPWREKLVMLDLSVTNTELTDTILEDVHLFSEWVTGKFSKSLVQGHTIKASIFSGKM